MDSVKSKQVSSTNQINILNQIQVRDAGTGVLENLSTLIFQLFTIEAIVQKGYLVNAKQYCKKTKIKSTTYFGHFRLSSVLGELETCIWSTKRT